MGTWVFRVDFSAGTVSAFEWTTAARITADTIRFEHVGPPKSPPYKSDNVSGTISRLTGTADWSVTGMYAGSVLATDLYHARCRRAGDSQVLRKT